MQKGKTHGMKYAGCIITDVEEDSLADEAGLRKGMRIDAVNGWGVSSDDELNRELSGKTGRTTLKVNTGPLPYCPNGCQVLDTTRHYLCECPAFDKERAKIFGDPRPNLSILHKQQVGVLKYIRATNRWDPKKWKGIRGTDSESDEEDFLDEKKDKAEELSQEGRERIEEKLAELAERIRQRKLQFRESMTQKAKAEAAKKGLPREEAA